MTSVNLCVGIVGFHIHECRKTSKKRDVFGIVDFIYMNAKKQVRKEILMVWVGLYIATDTKS